MYESRKQAPIGRKKFAHRVAWHLLGALALLALSLGVGMLGYHYLEQLPWLDAFLDAAMLLGGMGPPCTHPKVRLASCLRACTRCTPGWCSSSLQHCCLRPCCTACCTAFNGMSRLARS